MNYIILTASLLCSIPGHSEELVCYPPGREMFELVGFGIGLTNADRSAISSAMSRCSHYYPRSPCLVRMDKVGPNDYHATCGAKL